MARPAGIDPRKQAERDTAMWEAWASGRTQDSIATEYGLDQSSVSDALHRVMDGLPAPDLAAVHRRVLGWLDGLAAVHWPKAQAGDTESAKLMLAIIARMTRVLGLEAPRRVLVDAKLEPPIRPELADMLDAARARVAAREQTLRGELTRSNGHGAYDHQQTENQETD